jgi:hypothetical protein
MAVRELDPIEGALTYIKDLGGGVIRQFVRRQIIKNPGITTTIIIDNYRIEYDLPRKGRRKTDTKAEIVNNVNWLIGNGEVTFDEGLHYVWPPKQK